MSWRTILRYAATLWISIVLFVALIAVSAMVYVVAGLPLLLIAYITWGAACVFAWVKEDDGDE